MINISSLSSQTIVVDANAEAVSVIRLFIYSKLISSAEGAQAIDDLFDLEIQTIPVTRHLGHVALSWASKLQHARAYDSL